MTLPDDGETPDDDAETIGLIENVDEDAISLNVRGIEPTAAPLNFNSGLTAMCLQGVDSNLTPVIEQLRGHMNDMQDDLFKVHKLGDAVSAARVAVDELLYRRLSPRQYKRLNALQQNPRNLYNS